MRLLKSLWRALVVLAVLVVPAAAHEGHTHRYMGTIASVSGDRIELKTTTGKTVLFKLDDATRISRGSEKVTKDDVKVGVRAVIEADGAARQPAIAKSIKLPAADSKTT